MAATATATEIVRKLRELEVGQQQLQAAHAEMSDLFARAVVTHGNSSAEHHGHIRLNIREAERQERVMLRSLVSRSSRAGELV